MEEDGSKERKNYLVELCYGRTKGHKSRSERSQVEKAAFRKDLGFLRGWLERS